MKYLWSQLWLFALVFPGLSLAQNDAYLEEAGVNFTKGDSLMEEQRYEEAIKHFQEASNTYFELSLWQKHFRSLNKVSENYRRLKDLEKSLSLAQTIVSASLDKLGKNNSEEAMAYNHIGTIMGLKKDYDTAMDYFKKATSIQESFTGEARFDLGKTYNNIGVAYRIQKNHALSQKFFLQSLEVKQAIFGENHLSVTKTFNNLGKLFRDLGDYARAEAYFEKAISIQTLLQSKHHPSVGSSYYALAKVSENKGDYAKALEYNHKALQIRIIVDGESHKRVGSVYARIGLLHAYNQDYNLALEFLGKSLAIKKSVYGESHRYVAREYGNIGTVYENQGNSQQALEYHQKSLEIYLATMDNDDPELAFSYNNLGVVNDLIGNRKVAMEFYEKSLDIRKKALKKDNPRLAFSYRILGWAYQQRNNFSEALKYHQQAATLRKQVLGKKHPDLAKSYFDVADVLLQVKNYQGALDYCQKALIANVLEYNDTSAYSNPPTTNFLEQYVLLNSLHLKASVFKELYKQNQELKDLVFSLEILEIGDQLISLIRKNHLNAQDKLALGKESPKIYQKAIEVCHELYQKTKDPIYHRKAFFFSEKSKAGVLQLALSDNAAKNFGGIPNSLLALEKKIKNDVGFYRGQIQQEKKKGTGYDRQLVRGYEKDLFDLRRKSDSLALAFESNFPRYHHLKYQNQLSEIEELQRYLTDSKSALVEYFLSDSTLYAFAITNNDFKMVATPLKEDFYTLIQQFRSSIANRNPSNQQQGAKGFSNLAYATYEQIFAPIRSHLPNTIDKITVVPHGILSLVPFELMVSSQSTSSANDYRSLPYLLKEYQVSYAYSGTIWSEKQTKADTWENQFAGYAPSYQNSLLAEAKELAPYGNLRNEMVNLKYSNQEVDQAASFFKGSTFVGDMASEMLFKKEANKYQILHLAMHALVDEENPLQSKLIFSQNTDTTEDGFLNAFELYNMDLNAELVVLSACNTGYGKLAKGEGVMSLGRAFAYAGCPSIVMSLWPAQDQATADIMTYFYEGLSRGQPKDQALQAAKLKYLEQAEDLFSHPFYWAGFVVQGDTDPISIAPLNKWVWPMVGSVILLLLSLFMYSRSTRASSR